MKLKYVLPIFLSCLLSGSLIAQQNHRFTSRNFQQAVEKQTRTLKGVPGPEYWQNRSEYYIDVQVDIKNSTLIGKEKIIYFNYSKDTLDKIVFNLYQDIYRAGNSRDWDLGGKDISKGTEMNKLVIGGIPCDFNDQEKFQRNGTKLIAKTKQLLLPDDSLSVEVEWKVQIPDQRPIRMGKYNDSTYFIAYWYPQIAVYDDLDGWDMISYNGSVEFYNDFNDYQVNISLPDDFVVWSGGELQNENEVFSDLIADRLKQTAEYPSVSKIITSSDYEKKQVIQKNGKNTWKFISSHIPDFSFGFGKGKSWDRSKLKIGNNEVIINTVYNGKDKYFDEVTGFAAVSIDYMSDTWPGLPFPYPQVTVFCNGRTNGGMESPMMANNSAPHDKAASFALTFHEIAHNYFPFYMGTNEKKYAFMDEGWASYFPTQLADSLYPDLKSFSNTVKRFEEMAGYENDVPPMVLNQMLGANYQSLRLASYTRPAMAYHFLRNALGDNIFRESLHNFMQVWAGKHPVPSDFFSVMELTAGEDLSWYIEPWFYQFAYPDLAIRKVTKSGLIVVENIGGLPLPIELELTFINKTTQKITMDASVWNSGEKSVLVEFNTDSPLLEVTLGSDRIPDSNKKSNYMLFIDN